MKLVRCMLAIAFTFMCQLTVATESLGEAFRAIAAEQKVPQHLLLAIGLVESGLSHEKTYRPWPWTLNINGKPYYFKTREEAWQKLEKELASGQTNIDVGMMQLNYRYHGRAFKDSWEMLSPKDNLRVAAGLLRDYWENSRRWIDAAGRYHAPYNTQNANKYRKRVITALQGLNW